MVNVADNSINTSSPIAAYRAKLMTLLEIDMLPLPDKVGTKSVKVFVLRSSVSLRYTLKNQSFSNKLSSNKPIGADIFTVIIQIPRTPQMPR